MAKSNKYLIDDKEVSYWTFRRELLDRKIAVMPKYVDSCIKEIKLNRNGIGYGTHAHGLKVQ